MFLVQFKIDTYPRIPIFGGGMCTIYKALRSAGGLRRPLRSLRKEKYIELREADRRSIIEYQVYAFV